MKGYEHLEIFTEDQLWEQYVDSRDITIRNYFVEKNYDLVRIVVRKVLTSVPSSVTQDDLISFGILGLVDAIDKYDPNRENLFRTYAVTRIRGAIFDELRNIDWVPRSARGKVKEIEKAQAALELKLGRAAKDHEIASALDLSLEEYHKRLVRVGNSLISMDENWFVGDGGDKAPMSFEETLESTDASNPNLVAERAELKKMISRAIADLPDNKKKVLILYYYEELTLKEIGIILMVTESRVSQIHRDALEDLRIRLKEIQEKH
ncbi:MAG: FliA/WhiG family RNA polymerase sigma factor [Brevinema sp.]